MSDNPYKDLFPTVPGAAAPVSAEERTHTPSAAAPVKAELLPPEVPWKTSPSPVEAQELAIMVSPEANSSIAVQAIPNPTESERPHVELPGPSRLVSDFAAEIGMYLGPTHKLFRFSGQIVRVQFDKDGAKSGADLTLHPLTASEAVTEIENSIQTGMTIPGKFGGTAFITQSMTEQTAKLVLDSPQLRHQLASIERVLDVPTPILSSNGEVVLPKSGYDPSFRMFLNPSAPQPLSMTPDEARAFLLNEIFPDEASGGFCWKNKQSRVHAIARFITPLCRGLMGWKRAPLWIHDANRERCGKDYLAQVIFLLYTGMLLNGAPLEKDSEGEMRKRITSQLRTAARFIHFANMKGHIRFSALEAATDNSGVWEDRLLGQSKNIILPNEADFSFSANVGTTWEPDIEARSRRLSLHFTAENVNNRKFQHTDLHGFVLANRARALGAVWAFIQEWDRLGRPSGPTAFSSFPEWARIVGGIMVSCGLGDPCLPHEDAAKAIGDQQTDHMKQLFMIANEKFRERFVGKKDVYEIVQSDDGQELFGWIDLGDRGGQTRFGNMLLKFEGRELAGITLRIDKQAAGRSLYQFSGSGGVNHVNLVNLLPSVDFDDKSSVDISDEKGAAIMVPEMVHKVDEVHQTTSLKTSSPPSEAVVLDKIVGPSEPKITISQHGIENEVVIQKLCVRRSISVRSVGVRVIREQRHLKVITSLEQFPDIAATIKDAKVVALDIETYGPGKGDGLNPRVGDIRLMSFCVSGQTPGIIDLKATGYDLGVLGDALEEVLVLIHNATFEAAWLRQKCGLRLKNLFCTMTASRVHTNGSNLPNDLNDCLERYLGVAPSEDFSKSNWSAIHLTEAQLKYSARDVAHLHALAHVLRQELDKQGLTEANNLEQDILPVVLAMEMAGISVDRKELAAVKAETEQRAQHLAKQARHALGKPDLNLNSPKQMLEALGDVGIHVPKTSAAVLKTVVDDKFIPLILGYRKQAKLAEFASSLFARVQADGRIHGTFNSTGTDTGRFSASKPNLQNIPRGAMRSCFTAALGHKLIKVDLSMAELRVAAVIAGETNMIEALERKVDLHKQTAAAVLNKPLDAVTHSDRQLAKAVNFGFLFGQQAQGFVDYARNRYGVTLKEEQAYELQRLFFNTYPGLKRWHEQCWRLVREGRSEVRTVTGRRRIISADVEEWDRFTALVNTPVQGGCADAMKKAMVRLHAELPSAAKMLLTVHDELVVEAPDAIAEQVKEQVARVMREEMEKLFPGVPIGVEASVCANWGEK